MKRDQSRKRGGRRSTSYVLVCGLAIVLPAAVVCGQEGTYVGSWTNTTFGSTGGATIIVEFNGFDVEITADLDGGVFGLADPPPVSITGTLDGSGGAVLSLPGDPIFGDFNGSVSPAGEIQGTFTNLPVAFITEVTADGQIGEGMIHLDYAVLGPNFPNGRAVGVLDASIPEPATASLLAVAALTLFRRRRRR